MALRIAAGVAAASGWTWGSARVAVPVSGAPSEEASTAERAVVPGQAAGARCARDSAWYGHYRRHGSRARVKPNGDMQYSFPVDLAELLKDSSVFAKLDLEVMKSFSSKYAFALYEAVSRRINLKHKMTEKLDIDDIREMLGVEDGKLSSYRNLRLKAIEPAVTEVNAITPYHVTILPKNKGRKVIGFIMGWGIKDVEGMKRAYKELQQPKIGRRARIDGSASEVVE